MKLSKKHYTFIFSFALIVLVALQGYYIYNLYRLIEKDMNKEACEIGVKVMNFMSKYETDSNDDKILDYFKKLNHDEKKQFDELQIIRTKVDYNYEIYTPIVDSLLDVYSKENNFEIALRTDVYSVYDELNHKELLPKKKYVIYETTNKIAKPTNINQSVWSSDDISNQTDSDLGINKNERHKYKIRGKTDFELLNLKFLILKKIIPLIIVSLLIVGLIVFLYWKSLKNLSKQEEKINQLHLTIDSIAHELNTPITTMKFALHQVQHPETQQMMNRQINRLEQTVDSIFVKNDENSELLDEVILNEIIQKIQLQYPEIKLINQSIFEKNNVLKTNDFKQIAQNLIENSVKYGATEIVLDFKFQKKITLNFSDNGIGIPTNDLPLIFDKYYRVNRSINQNVSGLGVGLFLVKNTIERYLGTINVQNNKDKGVQFLIILPNEN
ncbi:MULTISPECIES: sensor histidine kinase [Empedobacter]|uniref:histidine kinase n=1 Tax=Empedobacter falsenii TaxID=343874 RepID=A0A427BK92_9FLAO|nr:MULTISPECIES: HAMP domain-containing sensor histidine kinase [Empedobacter]MBW1619216.1 HAMP domain-containing histidine kinase [Empedobacter falsenii]MBY0066458.1 HAMP domain-containing histidine kinase [Empedobacter falsenii]MDH0660382.1 HAMP domain-containing histidine kinase [Empedobacter sp. GD03865]MDH0675261.1 HAMP domain-containing histidine kinase [Empedobacter sp. GD03861]MDH1603258.1 HAMP domain-containing histidine kinase [Empedobacter sp. GD03739]